jgi:hypothetical protein
MARRDTLCVSLVALRPRFSTGLPLVDLPPLA